MCGPVTVLRVMQQPHLKQTRRSHAGALVTRLSPPVAEGDASLQGGSALESTPGSAFVKPGLSHARSHRGTAGPRRSGALPTHDSCPGRAATARRPAAHRGRSSGAESVRHCGRASTPRGRPRRGAAASSHCRQPYQRDCRTPPQPAGQ